jgi:hypothetical protein
MNAPLISLALTAAVGAPLSLSLLGGGSASAACPEPCDTKVVVQDCCRVHVSCTGQGQAVAKAAAADPAEDDFEEWDQDWSDFEAQAEALEEEMEAEYERAFEQFEEEMEALEEQYESWIEAEEELEPTEAGEYGISAWRPDPLELRLNDLTEGLQGVAVLGHIERLEELLADTTRNEALAHIIQQQEGALAETLAAREAALAEAFAQREEALAEAKLQLEQALATPAVAAARASGRGRSTAPRSTRGDPVSRQGAPHGRVIWVSEDGETQELDLTGQGGHAIYVDDSGIRVEALGYAGAYAPEPRAVRLPRALPLSVPVAPPAEGPATELGELKSLLEDMRAELADLRSSVQSLREELSSGSSLR